MEKEYTLIYQDVRKKRFFNMNCHNGGNIVLSQPGQEMKVTKTERDYLLKLKNGRKPVFAEKVEKKEKKISEVENNGLG